jgi:outer membrane biosynthesis protein TonB
VLVKWTTVRDFLKSNAIVRAFVISICVHLLAFLVIDFGNRLKLWDIKFVAQKKRTDLANLPTEQKEQQVVLQFVDVQDTQAPEPKDPKFYSAANSQEANPDTQLDTNKPKVDGQQDKVPQIRDVAKAEPTPPPQPKETMQPTFKPSAQPATKPPDEPVGDTKENTLTPEEKEKRDLKMDRPAQPQPNKPRPRTLAEARTQKGIIEGPKMKQEGGVKKYSLEMSPSAKATPFGSYDAAFIAAVQKRWFDILDARSYASDQTGKVIVEFRLYKDGRIMNLQVAETEVTDTLSWACQRAILDPAPYAPFPPDLRRLLGADYREVRFTFYYN